MDLKLKNKIVIVTGGAGIRGSIGQTIVYSLAEEGAIPVIICRSERGAEYERELRKNGIDATFFQADLCEIEQVEKAVNRIIKKYGRIDVLINNVGVNDGISLQDSVEDFMESLKLNLVSYFAMTKYCLQYLKKSKGNILNIGSKVALTGQGGTSGYAASKGGVLALTREWAVDLLPFDIRCNSIIIAESWTPAYKNWLDSIEGGTDKKNKIERKIPLGNRMTTPEEIADSCLFLISDRSSHTTGEYVFVDGGYVHLDRALTPGKIKN